MFHEYVCQRISPNKLLVYKAVDCNFRPLKGKELPRFPLSLVELECAEWDIWARNYLMADGSDLLGKFSNLQVLHSLGVAFNSSLLL